MSYPEFSIESWIVGFIDGEGCFSVSFTKREKLTLGIEVRASFSVSQKAHSTSSLKIIENYFKCGGIRFSRNDGTNKYEVRNFADLTHTILPFFKNYPLLTNKQKDFEIFERICSLIKQNQHLSKDGLIQIIELAYQTNLSGTTRYTKEQLFNTIQSKTYKRL